MHRLFIPRTRLVAFDPSHLLGLLNEATGLEPVARQLTFPVDSHRTPEAYILTVDVPGLTRDQIHLEAVAHRLTLTLDQAETAPADGVEVHRQERWRVHGQRQFTLPADAQVDQVKAALAQGVLTITVPRQVPEPPKVHTVPIADETPSAPVSETAAE